MITTKKRMKNMLDEENQKYLAQYMTIDEQTITKISSHCNRYNVAPRICAWYKDIEDFFSDWCDGCGYTRTEARRIYHGGQGEFQTFPNGNIVRYEI